MTYTDLSARDIVAIIACGKKAHVKELEYKGLKVVYNSFEDHAAANQAKLPLFDFQASNLEAPFQIPTETKEQNDDKFNDLIYTDSLAFEESMIRTE